MEKKQLDQFPTEILKSNVGEAQTLALSEEGWKGQGPRIQDSLGQLCRVKGKLGKMDILYHIIGKYVCIGMHDA